MKERNRLIAILLSAVMVISYMPSFAFAEAGEDDPSADIAAEEAVETETQTEEAGAEDEPQNNESESTLTASRGFNDSIAVIDQISFVRDENDPDNNYVEITEGNGRDAVSAVTGEHVPFYSLDFAKPFRTGDRLIVSYNDGSDDSVYVLDAPDSLTFVNEQDETDLIDLATFTDNSSQSLDDPWTAGNEYEFVLEKDSLQIKIPVRIVAESNEQTDDAIDHISFMRYDEEGNLVDPIELLEGLDGEYSTDENGEEYFVYEPQFKNGDCLEVYYKDPEKNVEVFLWYGVWGHSIDDRWEILEEEPEFIIEDDQDAEHWGYNETHTGYVSYLGNRTPISFKTVENPVKEVSFARDGGIELTEGVDGSINSDGANREFFEYEMEFLAGDTLTVTRKDENGQSITETYVAIINGEDPNGNDDFDEDHVSKFVKKSDDDPEALDYDTFIDTNELEVESDVQNAESEWKFGDGKNHWFAVKYNGISSAQIPVTLKENPVSSFTFHRDGNVILTEGIDGYVEENEDGFYFEYDFSFKAGDELEITGTDGNKTKYEAVEDEGKSSYTFYKKGLLGLDKDNYISENDIDWDDQPSQYDSPWEPDDGIDHAFVLKYNNRTYTVPVTLKENPVGSISFAREGYDEDHPIELMENVDGWYDDALDTFIYELSFAEGDVISVAVGNDSFDYVYDPDSDMFVLDGDSQNLPEGISESIDPEDIGKYPDDEDWKAGESHTVDIVYRGRTCTVKVATVQNPIESISFTRRDESGDPIGLIELREGYDGRFITDAEGERFFEYYPSFEIGDDLTIEYADADKESETYTYSFSQDGMLWKNGDKILDGKPAFVIEEEQSDDHWGYDEEHNGYVSYLGTRTPVSFKTVENSVKEVAFQRDGGVMLTEGIDGWINSDGSDAQFFEYDLDFEAGDTVTITRKSEDGEAITETYVAITNGEDPNGNEEWIEEFVYKFVKTVDGDPETLDYETFINSNELIVESSEQSAENEWKANDGKDHWFIVRYNGIPSNQIPVTLSENPVSSFEFRRSGGVKLREGIDGVNSDGGDSDFFEYEFTFKAGDELEITGTDGSKTTYEAVKDEGKSSYTFYKKGLLGLDKDEYITEDDIYWEDQPSQYDSPWAADDGVDHSIVIEYSGREFTVPVSLVGIKSIDFSPVDGDQTVSVADITEFYGENEPGYYYDLSLRGVDDAFYKLGDKLTLNYSSGPSVEYTYSVVDEGNDYDFVNDEYGAIIGWPYTFLETEDEDDGLENAIVGKNYINVDYYGKGFSGPYEITVVSDIADIQYHSAADIYLNDWDLDEIDTWWYAYDAIRVVNTEDAETDSLDVKFVGDDTTYTYTASSEFFKNEYGEDEGVPIPYFECTEPGGHTNKLFLDKVTDDQAEDNKWKAGNHEVTLSIRGFEVKRPVIVSEHNHVWAFKGFEWGNAEDGYTAKAYYECNEGSEPHGKEVEASTVIEEMTATCEESGTLTIRATVTAENSLDGDAHEDTNTFAANALGHDWDTPVYTWADDNTSVTATRVCKRDDEHAETETVIATAEVTKPATCEAKGETTYTPAAFENKAFDQQAPKTVENINALGHDWGAPAYTWADDNSEVTATRVCKHDGKHVETEAVATTSEVTKPATCEAKGETTYTPAAFENKAFEQQAPKTVENINALGHDWGAPVYTWADDNSSVTATRICKHDDGHVETETVATTAEVTKPATCETRGETTYTPAAFKNKAFAQEPKTIANIEALGHNWKFAGFVWTESGGGYNVVVNYTCENDKKHTESINVEPELIEGEAPTCNEGGSAEYQAIVDAEQSLDAKEHSENKTRTSDALGHDWGAPTYTWADDNSSVTATRVCKRDDEHVETETVATTAEVTKPATCEAKGETTYTPAAFANKAFEQQAPKTVENINALGHDWGAPAYTWADDNSSVTATRVCKHDSKHVDTETVATTAEVTKPATCEAKGETTFTPAEFENEAFEQQAPKTVENISALGHNWGEGEVTAEPKYKEAGVRTFTCANDNEHVKTESIPSFKDLADAAKAAADEAAKTPGANAVQKAIEAETAAEEAYNQAKEESEAAPDDEDAAAALNEAKLAYDNAKAATQRARDAKAAAEAEAARPKEVTNYSLPTVKNYKPNRSKSWIKARWKKLSKKNRKKVQGIEIQYSTNKWFTDGQTWSVYTKKSGGSKKIKGLARKTTYYTRVRTYTYVGNVRQVSKWSKVKKNKTR